MEAYSSLGFSALSGPSPVRIRTGLSIFTILTPHINNVSIAAGK